MNKTISFRGAAAKAFMGALMGDRPATEDEKLERVATFVSAHVKSGDMAGARLLLSIMHRDGLDRAVAAVTAKKGA